MLHPYCQVMNSKIESIYEETRDQIMLHHKSPHAQVLIGGETRGANETANNKRGCGCQNSMRAGDGKLL